MFWAVNYRENCIIKHHKENYHKVVPFFLIHNVLFVRIMRDYAEIYKLCNRMQCMYLINYTGSHHHTLSEALTCRSPSTRSKSGPLHKNPAMKEVFLKEIEAVYMYVPSFEKVLDIPVPLVHSPNLSLS